MTMYRRKNYFIKKGFQSRFILPFLIVSFLGVVVSITFFTLISYARIDSILYSMRIPEAVMSKLFFKEALIADIAAMGIVVIMFIFTTKGIVRKVTGPLSTVQYGLRRMSEGDLLARIHLRAGDEFKDFADQINKMAEGLGGKFGQTTNHARQLDRRVRDLVWTSEDKDKQLLKEMIAGHIAAIEDQLKAFKK